ncbi:hypothetical protein IFM89_002996 [Coptis chinensis]|uniref:CCHC-type domain-containing protein n=1 Tax=Coptis chinensis TaxID=261450 RepID=A0A835IVG7_9MAGN|nr:hypothetical protein IFM89_002996 [Coptis chinensis]
MSLRIKSLDEYKWYKHVFLERASLHARIATGETEGEVYRRIAEWPRRFGRGKGLKEDDLDLMTFGELVRGDRSPTDRALRRRRNGSLRRAIDAFKVSSGGIKSNTKWSSEKKKFSEKHSSRRPSKGGKERRCYKCNKIGHYAKDCKAKRVGAFFVQDREDTSRQAMAGKCERQPSRPVRFLIIFIIQANQESHGNWFEIVSCPHYLAEIVIYAGLLVASGGSDPTIWLLFGFVAKLKDGATVNSKTTREKGVPLSHAVNF